MAMIAPPYKKRRLLSGNNIRSLPVVWFCSVFFLALCFSTHPIRALAEESCAPSRQGSANAPPASTETGDKAAGAVAHLALLPEARITSPKITLSAIAEISAPPQIASSLGKIQIGRAPLPGRSRLISRGYIKMRLRAAGIDPAGIEFSGPDAVRVLGPLPSANPTATANNTQRGCTESRGSPGNTAEGTARGGHPRRCSLSPSSAPTQPPDEPVVKRGQEVYVRAICGLVTVIATGRALESGRVGDLVRVQITRGKRVLARVLGPHQAEVVTWPTDK